MTQRQRSAFARVGLLWLQDLKFPTAILYRIQVFRDVTMCLWISIFRRFDGLRGIQKRLEVLTQRQCHIREGLNRFLYEC